MLSVYYVTQYVAPFDFSFLVLFLRVLGTFLSVTCLGTASISAFPAREACFPHLMSWVQWVPLSLLLLLLRIPGAVVPAPRASGTTPLAAPPAPASSPVTARSSSRRPERATLTSHEVLKIASSWLPKSLRPALSQPCSPCLKPYSHSLKFHPTCTHLCTTPASISVSRCGGNSSSGPTGSLATVVGTSPGSLWYDSSAQTPGVTSYVFQTFRVLCLVVEGLCPFARFLNC